MFVLVLCSVVCSASKNVRFGSKVCVLGLQRKFALVSNSVVCNSFGLKLCGLQDFNECFSASVVV